MYGSKPRTASQEAVLALGRHRQNLEVFLEEWGRNFESLVMDLADSKQACGYARLRQTSAETAWSFSTDTSAATPAARTHHASIALSQRAASRSGVEDMGTIAESAPDLEEALQDEKLAARCPACGWAGCSVCEGLGCRGCGSRGCGRCRSKSGSRAPVAEGRANRPQRRDFGEAQDCPISKGDVAASAEGAVVQMAEQPCGSHSEVVGHDPITPPADLLSNGAESADIWETDKTTSEMLGIGETPTTNGMLRARRGSIARSCAQSLDVLVLEPPKPRAGAWGCVARCVASQGFEALAALIIVVNAIYIAYASDQEMRRVLKGLPENSIAFRLEIGFTSWYALELVARLYVYGRSLYMCDDWKWNIFDTILVAVSLQDVVVSSGNAGPAFLRIMRLARMMKLLRVIRLLRMFRELRLILNAVLGCMKSMFWAMVLIVNVSFIFGLCFLQATTEHLRKEGDYVDPQIREELLHYWGGVGASMYSLYSAALGGVDWDVQADSLRVLGLLFWLLYLLFIGFFFCVITNTLTSLFVEATMINAQRDKDQVIEDELDHKEVYIQKLKSLFLSIGGGRGQSVSMHKFMENIHHPDMIYFAATIGIETVDLKQFFRILSANGGQTVDVEAFVVGCIKLKGVVKSMDLMDMKISLRRENLELRKGLRAIERTVEAVARAVGVENIIVSRRNSSCDFDGALL